jgi:hypothetical protein
MGWDRTFAHFDSLYCFIIHSCRSLFDQPIPLNTQIEYFRSLHAKSYKFLHDIVYNIPCSLFQKKNVLKCYDWNSDRSARLVFCYIGLRSQTRLLGGFISGLRSLLLGGLRHDMIINSMGVRLEKGLNSTTMQLAYSGKCGWNMVTYRRKSMKQLCTSRINIAHV